MDLSKPKVVNKCTVCLSYVAKSIYLFMLVAPKKRPTISVTTFKPEHFRQIFGDIISITQPTTLL